MVVLSYSPVLYPRYRDFDEEADQQTVSVQIETKNQQDTSSSNRALAHIYICSAERLMNNA